MKILIFDTETSGLYPGFNVILQLSYQIVDSDSWATTKAVNHYFPWPAEKARVSPEAIDVNGLSEEFLASQQLSERKAALEEFVADKDACDLIVAHNLEFDKKFIIASCREEGVKYANSGWSQSYDTMKRTTNFCKIYKSWGSGYKWPTLTELAQHLNIDYSDITLHDSSGDVELTKQCFEKLVRIGVYQFPKETGITVILHVEGPDDIQFIVKDENGVPLGQSALERLPKKNLKEAQQELIRMWAEENEQELDELQNLHRKSSKLKTANDYLEEIAAIKPEKYVRKAFDEEPPSKDKLQEELEAEAREAISSWKFWTLKKKRQEYVEARLESYCQQETDAYNKRLAQHEKHETEVEEAYNLQSQKQCEVLRQQLSALLEGNDKALLERELDSVPAAMDISVPYRVSAQIQDGTSVYVNLSLPRPEDMPQMEGVRLSSGNYKIKEISDKNKKANYSHLVRSLAPYVASHYFNVSPKINSVCVEGNASVDDNEESIILYNVIFDRTSFGTLNLEGMELDDVLSNFSVTNNINKETLAKLFVAKEKEKKQEKKAISDYMLDPIFADVARYIVLEQNSNTAVIQRKFEIGYNRVGSLMEQLEKAGIVGPARGSNPREVLIRDEEELMRILNMISPSRQ